MDDGQTSMIDILDQLINEGDERRISQAKNRLELDGYRMVTMHELKTVLPLGTVIIIEHGARGAHDGRRAGEAPGGGSQ